MRRENNAQKTINLKRPISGSKKRPTCTVPAEHSQARQAADDNYDMVKLYQVTYFIKLKHDFALTTKRIRTIPVGVFKC